MIMSVVSMAPIDESRHNSFQITRSDSESVIVKEFDSLKIKDRCEHVTSDKSEVLDGCL